MKFMVGLTAYFDESGHSDDSKCRFVGMGGLCAPLEAWEKFDEKWQSILDAQCGGEPFHMNKFSAHEDPYKGWGKERREALLGALVQAIKESGAKPFGAVVSLDAYDLVCGAFPGVDSFFGNPYLICFMDCTVAAAASVIGHSMRFSHDVKQLMEFERTESVAMVYAHQQEYGTISSPPGSNRQNMGKAESIWYGIKEAHPAIGRWMGSYSSALAEDLNFLQATDLFAYELTHEFENRINRPDDKMRWALAQMLPGTSRDFLHKLYGVPQLLEVMIENNALLLSDDLKYGGLTNAALDKVEHRDLLFGRMYERRKRDND
jgi:hypothetical protein